MQEAPRREKISRVTEPFPSSWKYSLGMRRRKSRKLSILYVLECARECTEPQDTLVYLPKAHCLRFGKFICFSFSSLYTYIMEQKAKPCGLLRWNATSKKWNDVLGHLLPWVYAPLLFKVMGMLRSINTIDSTGVSGEKCWSEGEQLVSLGQRRESWQCPARVLSRHRHFPGAREVPQASPGQSHQIFKSHFLFFR